MTRIDPWAFEDMTDPDDVLDVIERAIVAQDHYELLVERARHLIEAIQAEHAEAGINWSELHDPKHGLLHRTRRWLLMLHERHGRYWLKSALGDAQRVKEAIDAALEEGA